MTSTASLSTVPAPQASTPSMSKAEISASRNVAAISSWSCAPLGALSDATLPLWAVRTAEAKPRDRSVSSTTTSPSISCM